MTAGETVGRLLLVLGVVIALLGGLLLLAGRIPIIGRLPGDLSFEWGGVKVYLPLATSLLLSLLLTVLLSLIARR